MQQSRSHDRSRWGRRQLLRIALVFSSASKLATAPVTRRSRGSRARGACQSSRRSRGCLGPGAFAPDAASASRWWLLRLRRSTAAAIGETMLVTNEAVLRCQCGEVLPAPSLAGIRHKGFDSGASRHGSRLRPGESRSPRPLKPWLRARAVRRCLEPRRAEVRNPGAGSVPVSSADARERLRVDPTTMCRAMWRGSYVAAGEPICAYTAASNSRSVWTIAASKNGSTWVMSTAPTPAARSIQQ